MLQNENDSLTPVRIIHIESATEICSVALSVDTEVVTKKEVADSRSHSRNLILFVEDVIKRSGIDRNELSAVCFSAGPGSYTGLRIGASTAKGLAYSLRIPLISVPTLESIALGAKSRHKESQLFFCPMIDARRMEVFTALYDSELHPVLPVSSQIVDDVFIKSILEKGNVVFCCNGVEKCRSIIAGFENAICDLEPLSAANMVLAAFKKYKAKDFEDTAYFEPFYLKEYIAAKSHVKGLQ